MRICIIGTGYVGLVTGAVFASRGHDVLCVDKEASKIEALRAGRVPIYEPGLEELIASCAAAGRLRFSTSTAEGVEHGEAVFVAVGTPPLPSGKADLSSLEEAAREITAALQEYRVIVEKSTVPVKTGERLRELISRHAAAGVEFDVASNPEFLREGNAIQDALAPDRIVLGVASKRAEKVLREVYRGYECPIIVTDIASAELIKHASNSFLALKISFANALANVCERAGANVEEVTRGMGLDARIGSQFLRAGLGYGGSCFGKDVAAFADIAAELGYEMPLLGEVQRINQEQRTLAVRKIEKELWILKDKRIAVLGLAFKPDTDDVRDSAAVALIEMLLAEGARVTAYDPRAAENARELLQDRIEYAPSVYQAIEGADCLLLATEWQEFRELDLGRVKEIMAQPIVVDGRNMWDPEELTSRGFTYRSVGR